MSGGDILDLHDYLNVQRIFRLLAAQWGCPVWAARQRIRIVIDQSWEKAKSDPEAEALWKKYFPEGKPTPDQYVLWLGHAHERGEEMPYLLKE